MARQSSVFRIQTIGDLDHLEENWRKLDQIQESASIFQSWLWNRTWCEYVLPQRKHAHLDIRVVEDSNGTILAILPLFREPLLGPFAHIVQFIGHRMTFHNDVLLAEPTNPDLADYVIQVLLDSLGTKDVLHLRNLYENSVFTKQLVAKGLAEPHCPRVWLESNNTILDHRMRLGASRRKSLRLGENRMRRQFDMKFSVQSGEDCSEAINELLDLHNKRFDSMGRSSLLTGSNATFLKHITAQLSKNRISEVIQIKGNNSTIAAALMMRDKDRYFFVNGGFDPAFSRFSPMRVLLTETMRRGFDDLNCQVYELGPGYEAYKYDWSPNVTNAYFSCLAHNGLWAQGVATVYRHMFRYKTKSLLPKDQARNTEQGNNRG